MSGNRYNNGGGGGSSSRSPSSSSSPNSHHRQQQHHLALPPSSNTLAPPTSPALSRSPSSLSLFAQHPPPLHLTIRFSAALPDLHLDILTPHRTTIVALKHLIRARLAADADASNSTPTSSFPTSTDDSNSNNNNNKTSKNKQTPASAAARGRLRFIHAGRILPDHSALSTVLKVPPPPPHLSSSPSASSSSTSKDPKGKGKGVEGRGTLRVFVNCSIGDELTDAELAEEAAAAAETPPSPPPPSSSNRQQQQQRGRTSGLRLDTSSPNPNPTNTNQTSRLRSTTTTTIAHHHETNNTTPAPRGFDRLLSTGFTPAEVNQLRLQFRSIQAQRHTPDTMPSPDTLRSMEDAWIDSNNSGTAAGAAFTGTGDDGADTGGDDNNNNATGMNAVVDALVMGMFIGFVFPLGAVGWLLREEGMWSKRSQVFVALGFLLSFSVGVVRGLTGEN
ncbi:DUF2407 C-terminal domain-containing protein [Bombardia bombarda]|uniref:DUF2407 C-terminal domain-containing protein n=1 Tax=Bombardia bombarda TaxID=252184 RepID=A0AA39XIJ6_9PEZI|nr:DUF2407 C-terminal domain-containing protein [Bombardia bombarda]